MPIWLRKFTFKEIKDFYEEEKKEYEKAKIFPNFLKAQNPELRISNYFF